MSRYTLLILLNVPLVVAGILNAVVTYKMRKTSRKRFLLRAALWFGIFVSLIFTESIYNFLFTHQLTQTEPLSLFDVIQITGIIITLFIATQVHSRVDNLERRIHDLHQELSIILSSRK